ncbi:MAG: molybdopterin biosynthesis protein [Planctomycetes bacterium]|nr:molybdopterin biosynthesis protein [Planctomycetota bacterium]
MSTQEQFLDVIDRDEAERRFQKAINTTPRQRETVPLAEALTRVLAEDVVAAVDVPSFDRSNYDGFAVRAVDTYGATEEAPRELQLLAEAVETGSLSAREVAAGTAMAIATGGALPRGADAVVMIEHTDAEADRLIVRRAVTPGFGVAFAGTDISTGETVLRRGNVLTSRETGVLAAIGVDEVVVWRRPRVAIISTGDEIIEPGEPMRPGLVYDSNARILADAVRELGGEPQWLGIVRDDLALLRERLHQALQSADVVLLSGGTSKGQGDLSYRAVAELDDPGIVAHGVALKPGKPICLAASAGKPVVILPGFPTSAIFTFHEFVAPVIRSLGGKGPHDVVTVAARLAVKVNSEIGRTEYLLVGLVESVDATTSSETEPPCPQGDAAPPSKKLSSTHLVAYPMGKGSGSVTTFSHADGFVTIGRHEEIVEAGTPVDVQLLGRELRPADLVVIGSHCVGLDYLLGRLQERGFATKFLAVGSTAGLEAAKRGECDVAGMHLMDPDTGEYNRPFLTSELTLIRGYARCQGVLFRRGDERFEGKSAAEVIAVVKNADDCLMINRNQGSGTRILIDQYLDGAQPSGYAVQARNHNAIAAAVLQGRADWGVAIQSVAESSELGFLPLADEQYDFVVPKARQSRPAVAGLVELLADEEVIRHLGEIGLEIQF